MSQRDDNAPPASASRPRRKWRWVGVGLLLFVGLSVMYWTYLRGVAEKGWQAAVAEAEEDDPNWRWDDMQARRRTWKDEENGALVMRAAKALLPRRWPAWDIPLTGSGLDPVAVPDAEGTAPARVSRQEAERLALQESFGPLEPPVQLDARQLAALREELKKADKAVAEARRMAKFPGGRFPLQYTADFFSALEPDLDDSRSLANMLGYDVLLRAQEEDLTGALTSCQALLHLSRYFDEEPPLMALLVRFAIRGVTLRRLERILAQGESEAADLARLQKVLEEEEAVPVLLKALRGERAGGDRMMQQMESGQSNTGQLAAQRGAPPLTPWGELATLIPGGMRKQRVEVLKVNNRLIALAKLPAAQWKLEAAKLQQETPSLPILARLLVPAHLHGIDIAMRTTAQLRCALVMLAAERYRRTHGRWPETLVALVPDFLTQIPEDPFDGKSLRSQRVNDGLVIYSVSHDGTDDGGKLSSNPADKGTDLGFRLWNVKQRRQPPKPRIPPEPGSLSP